MRLNSEFEFTKAVEVQLYDELRMFSQSFHGKRQSMLRNKDKDMMLSIFTMYSLLAKDPNAVNFATMEAGWITDAPNLPRGFLSVVLNFKKQMEEFDQDTDPERMADYCVLEALNGKRMYLARNKTDSWVNKLSILWLWLYMTFIRTNVNARLSDAGPAYQNVLGGTLKLIDDMVVLDKERLQRRFDKEKS